MADNGALRNEAFVFVKPHAVNDNVVSLVKAELTKRGFNISGEGSISSSVIDEKQLIDKHYYAIASKATLLTPDQLNVPADKFEGKFGLSWVDALASGNVVNATEGGRRLGLDAEGLERVWRTAKQSGNMIKFGGGFYCAFIQDLYIFNGFFMSMRNKYVAEGCSIHWFTVDFSQDLSWEDFRGKVLGPTDPSSAPADSIRGMIYAQWESLGLPKQSDTGDNGVHASASPFEGLAERMNWLGAKCEEENFGQALMNGGVSAETISAWSVDPQVKTSGDGAMGSLFDAVEDMTTDPCLAKCIELNGLNAKAERKSSLTML